MLGDFGMVVEDGDAAGERRWGGVVGRGRRLRGYAHAYGDDFAPIDFDTLTDPTVTTGADYTSNLTPDPTDPTAFIPAAGDTPTTGSENNFNTNLQFDPKDPSAAAGVSPSTYDSIVKAAQAAAGTAGTIIKAATNSNGSVSCGSGYIYDPVTKNCYRVPGGFDTTTLLMVGAGGLGLLALFFLLKK